MLAKLGLRDLSQLFGHIDPHLLFPHPLPLPEEKGYNEVAEKFSKFPTFQIIKFPSSEISSQFGKLHPLLSLYPI